MATVSTVTPNQNTANNPHASASLYVGDLAKDVTEATLFELFNAVGPVASIRVCRDSSTHRSLGYAYVNFHSVQDAERALDTMNFETIRGKQCRMMWSQRDPQLRNSGKGNVFVSNLHDSIDNKTLYDTFSVFGNILSCKVVVSHDTSKSLGYGYVQYIDEQSAQKAIKGVNGMKISEKVVNAELFKPREKRKLNYKFTNVYVKYIPRVISDQELINMFEKETGGKVKPFVVWRPEFGVSACLNFDKPECALKAIELFNGREMKEFLKDESKEEKKSEVKESETKTLNKETPKEPPTKLFVTRAQKKKEREGYLTRQKRKYRGGYKNFSGANLYIKNITPDVDDEKLKDLFKSFGKITSAKVMCDANGNSRGFGFVAFETKESATRAMSEMGSKNINGKPLYVSRAQTKEFRRQYIMKQIRNKQRNFQGRNNYNQVPYYLNQTQRPPLFPPQFSAQNQQPFQFPQNQIQPQIPRGPFYPMLPNRMPTTGLPPNLLMGSGMNNPLMLNQSALPRFQTTQPQTMPNQAPSQSQQPNQPSSQTNPQQSGSVIRNRQSGYSGGPAQPVPSNQNSAPLHSSVPGMSSGNAQSSAVNLERVPLTSQMLASAKPAERKRLIGERLFPKIQVVEPRLAGKITGMLLEMENTELLVLIQDQNALLNKINEALAVLKDHIQKKSQSGLQSGKNSGKNISRKNQSQSNHRHSAKNSNKKK